MVSDVREVFTSRELLVNLTRRELRSKYKGTTLGWFWSLINPLATAVVFTLVFSLVMRIEPPVGVDGLRNYTLFLLCGLLTWNFMSGSLSSGMGTLVGNANLIKKSYFPRRLLVISNTLSLLVTYLIELAVLACVFLVFGVNVLPGIPVVLLVVALLTVFSLGVALAFAAINVYFRDMPHFVAIGLQIWFYATPIIYPISMVESLGDSGGWKSVLADLYLLNPVLSFVEAIRDVWYSGISPNWVLLGYAAVVSLVVLVIGNAVFSKFEPRLGEEL